MNIRQDRRGFTLVEVTIILLVLVILSTIMLPQLGNFNRLARFVKVKEDLGAICSVMKKMLDEVMSGAFYGIPGEREQPIGLLVGPGDIPLEGRRGFTDWHLEVYDDFYVRTDYNQFAVDFVVDRFEQHLQENDPLNRGRSAPWYRYKNPLDNPERSGAGAFFGWRGPYLDEFTADPWGNRYASNVFALYKKPGAYDPRDIFSSAVVCYSAGPDGAVDTAFNQPMNDRDGDGVFGWVTGDDDLAVVLSAGGPF